MVGFLDIKRHNSTHPALTMNDIWSPSQFLYCLQDASRKEDGTLSIISILFTCFICCHLTLGKIIIIIYKIDLNS